MSNLRWRENYAKLSVHVLDGWLLFHGIPCQSIFFRGIPYHGILFYGSFHNFRAFINLTFRQNYDILQVEKGKTTFLRYTLRRYTFLWYTFPRQDWLKATFLRYTFLRQYQNYAHFEATFPWYTLARYTFSRLLFYGILWKNILFYGIPCYGILYGSSFSAYFKTQEDKTYVYKFTIYSLLCAFFYHLQLNREMFDLRLFGRRN